MVVDPTPAVHHVVLDPDPAHPAAHAGDDAGVPEHKVRVIAPDVGGGFGGKLQVTPEEVIALLVARRIGKPVKYTESRSESMLAAHHGRDRSRSSRSPPAATAPSPA